ncbi:MAG: circularly permuted type 2 ATP-grasp protein [Alphaproteobacteria bacterium]
MTVKSTFDEMMGPGGAGEGGYAEGAVRDAYGAVRHWLDAMSQRQVSAKRKEAETLFRRMGITFLVYGTGESTERLIPFDIIPRVITADEWTMIENGCLQRVRAINAFLSDIYHDGEIIAAGRIPSADVYANPRYRPEMIGIDIPGNTYIHITGIDLVRTAEREFYVLEDNLRNPSGVSYMLENREVMMRLFPQLFADNSIAPVIDYPTNLLRNLQAVAPPGISRPTVALLTPGIFNSAYFEHVFLADEMGIELVEGQDLFVLDDQVFMRTTHGPVRVDVIYRRIDDNYLDPLAFMPDSLLGVPGLLSAYRAGGVTLANAIGTGVADDKAIYIHVPEMIRFYLGEEPILANVPTHDLRHADECAYVLDHLGELVVKEVGGAGGYGMLVGPAATRDEIECYRARILDDPANFIAQPTLALSTCPTFIDAGIAPRHVDLRPFVLSGTTQTVVPGGLTRVALGEGSLVVNTSQGGGTKDTWVLRDGAGAP